MCDIKEAKRHEQLAEIYLGEKDSVKAKEHYLEATAIYVLNIELLKDESLLKKANVCYQKVQSLRGEKLQIFSKTELAQLTVKELGFSPSNHHHDHNHDHNHSSSSNHNHDHLISQNHHHQHDHQQHDHKNHDHHHNHNHNNTVLSEIEVLL